MPLILNPLPLPLPVSTVQAIEVRVAWQRDYGWEWLAVLLEDAGYELHLAWTSSSPWYAAAAGVTDYQGEPDCCHPGRDFARGGQCCL